MYITMHITFDAMLQLMYIVHYKIYTTKVVIKNQLFSYSALSIIF